jgi:hypothetical protein
MISAVLIGRVDIAILDTMQCPAMQEDALILAVLLTTGWWFNV